MLNILLLCICYKRLRRQHKFSRKICLDSHGPRSCICVYEILILTYLYICIISIVTIPHYCQVSQFKSLFASTNFTFQHPSFHSFQCLNTSNCKFCYYCNSDTIKHTYLQITSILIHYSKRVIMCPR